MKSVKISRIKNFVIVVLTLSAIYQTALLWLENDSGHNFFYSFFQKGYLYGESSKLPAEAPDPKKIVIGYGNKTFSVKYPNPGSNIMSKTNSFIEEAMKTGHAEASNMPFDDIISQKCIVLDFAVGILPSQYMMCFGVNESLDELSSLDSITQVVAVPFSGSTGESQLYIMSGNSSTSCCLNFEGGETSRTLLSAIDTTETHTNEKPKYISTKQSGFNIFNDTVFVPQWSQNHYEYTPVTMKNPFSSSSTELLAAVETTTESFFTDHTSKTASEDANGVISLSTSNIIVKYYPSGVLEYFNYSRSDNNVQQTLPSAYFACRRFLDNDKSLNTNIFLSEVVINSRGLTFSFDYSVNDMPVYLSPSLKNEIEMKHSIEVYVENGAVKKYRRYARDFVPQTEASDKVEIDFLGAMNSIMARLDKKVSKVDNIVLGHSSDNGQLTWYVTIDGTEYTAASRETSAPPANMEE